MEAWKKLFLVGFAVLVLPGRIEQLVIAFLFSLIFLLILSIAMPFKRDDDDYFAKLCNFALSIFFFFSVCIKASATPKYTLPSQPPSELTAARLDWFPSGACPD